MRIFTFTIPAITPSNNKLVKGRTHWSSYRRMKEDWFYLLKLGSQNLDIPAAADFEKRKVEVISYRLALLDQDNLAGGMKLLWDAMVDAGYLYDDGPSFLDAPKPAQGVVHKRKDQRTEVRITIFEEGL